MNRSASSPQSLLDGIVRAKRREAEALAGKRATLRREAEAAGAARAFARALVAGDAVALIGEFKRRSPSAGRLGGAEGPVVAVRAYEAGGAAALSVLTDADYFGGSLEDLRAARAAVGLPVLRKDFVVDGVQVLEARAAGADAVLLIVRILDDAQLRELLGLCDELGFDALVEVHDAAELDRALAAGSRLIGVNNRDLATFETDLSVSLDLAPRVPVDRVLVAESGIRSGADVDRLGAAGFHAVLVGEALMRAPGGVASLVGRARRPRGAPVRAGF